MDGKDILLLGNFLILCILAFSVQSIPDVNTETVELTNKTVNVTQERISVTCPKPNVTVTDEYRHIQNPEMQTGIRNDANGVLVEDADTYGKLYGSSMAPSMMEGDKAILEDYRRQDLEEGMIIRFKKDGNHVIHRIVGDYTENDYVLTRGDNNDGEETVPVNKVTHIVKGVVYH